MLRNLLETELALAESVLRDGEHPTKKVHGPTLDHFKGRAVAYKRVMSLLETEKILPRDPIRIIKEVRVNISWKVLALVSIGGIIIYYVTH